MSVQRHRFSKTALLGAAAALAMFVLGPSANATVVRIHFSSAAGSGYADLELGTTNAADVVDSSHKPVTITHASGVFHASGDSTGITITGLLAVAPAAAPPGEVLPASYSLVPVPHDQGGGDHNGVSYDNLFYPNGSPVICLINGTPAFPFGGGFLDLMGVMFTLDNDNLLDVWSFGLVTAPGVIPAPVGRIAYGMKVVDTHGDTNAVLAGPPFGTASIPEPDFLWLFGAAVLGVLVWRRSVQSRKRSQPA